MPDISGFDYLSIYLDEFGPASHGASGIIPVSFSELKAWSQMTENVINGWESSMLITMSKQYCYQSYSSEVITTQPPYFDNETETEMSAYRALTQQKIKKMF